MSTSDRCPVDPRPDTDGRYVSIDVNDTDVMLYDVDQSQAWIRSDTAIQLDSME